MWLHEAAEAKLQCKPSPALLAPPSARRRWATGCGAHFCALKLLSWPRLSELAAPRLEARHCCINSLARLLFGACAWRPLPRAVMLWCLLASVLLCFFRAAAVCLVVGSVCACTILNSSAHKLCRTASQCVQHSAEQSSVPLLLRVVMSAKYMHSLHNARLRGAGCSLHVFSQ